MNNNDLSSKFKYILLPLPLLQEVFKKPKTGIDYIFAYGIYRSAMAQNIDEDNAFKQVIYCYYRGGLTKSLERQFDTLIDKELIIVGCDEDYNGFSCDSSFDPEDEIISLKEYIENNNDEDLKDEIIEFHRLRQIKDVLGVNFDIETTIATYRSYEIEYKGFEDQPVLMVKKDMMFDYLTNEKSEFEKVLFTTYLGLRSLMGRKNDIIETTQEMIFWRFVGAKDKETLAVILKDKKVKSIYNKYNNRYQIEKILETLQALNFISSKIGYNRRTYISFTLSIDELPKAIADRIRDKNINFKRKDNKINELEAKKDLLRLLYK